MNWYSNFRVHACEWLTIFLNCVGLFFFSVNMIFNLYFIIIIFAWDFPRKKSPFSMRFSTQAASLKRSATRIERILSTIRRHTQNCLWRWKSLSKGATHIEPFKRRSFFLLQGSTHLWGGILPNTHRPFNRGQPTCRFS